MTMKQQARAPGSFILTEANGARSRDNAAIPNGVAIVVGQVLGKLQANAASIAVGTVTFAGTGNGVLTKANPAFGDGVQEGNYLAQLVSAGANAGQFEVIRPDGAVDGFAQVGVAYNGQVKFTIADGSTDFAAPAAFTIPVAVTNTTAAGTFKPLNTAGTDGSQQADAIAIYPLAADADYRQIAVMSRDCEVIAAELEWPNAISDDAKATAIAQLAAVGIIVR